ncbi:MAG: glutamine--fructose-6-phosphate transaminase (isomerizing) [archaeon]|nr:glutamine--fructose-6-phosphate transaminase (isomerizing) [archaeon]MDD2477486.1 glutamine--fructose-6-phosphate transaminase (isomerizing) [Candidatus ainarchaeum sp.]MDD3084770.1 glutamine--fructose-6-phosphate transaminase (isomerizing) [Candidatus ainarchaeum sp.]MDD4221446.1 glutamine--fructose-6-phosphate transaminase (isomerizing) [Candidatus ainarchaeum sp.]MDD4662410.1 glutamine--fructose-6-phosphate transaminase (isomerizing) [Candidatus ainarchaeum sp.]
MCGIIGYIGKKEAIPILINGLKRLEYRGYDSCGVCIHDNNLLKIIKAKGKIVDLEKRIKKENNLNSTIGIAHTRWATHGIPNEINAHPHFSEDNNLAIVHNGIIENYDTIKLLLQKEGYVFKTQTDSEVIAFLVNKFYKKSNNLKDAVLKALTQITGTYGLLVLSKDKREIIVARKGSPIIIGIGKNEFFVASDTSAILEYTKNVIYLDDFEIAKITDTNYEITSLKNQKINKEIHKIKTSLDQIEKSGYKHFMLKEIFEQPEKIKDALSGRIDFKNNRIVLGGICLTKEFFKNINKIVIVACGTSWHCALIGKFVLEKYLRISVEVDYASEFRYRNPIIDENSLVIAISQSGETADTLAAIKEAKEKKAKIFGIVNVVGSTIARTSDCGIYTRAGPEIGVASTKAFTNQLVSLWLLTLFIGQKLNKITEKETKEIINNLNNLPEKIKIVLNESKKIKEIASKFKNSKNFLYLGRGINYPIALEGALKLKEISYIHAEGYPAAEMKHGPIALIDKNMPSVFIINKNKNYDKIISNMQEIKARGGIIISIATKGDEQILKLSDHTIFVPKMDTQFTTFVNVIAMQLLAYYIADHKNCEIDKPRNLAKSVTVE